MNKNILVAATAVIFSAIIYTSCKKSDDSSDRSTETCADGIQNQNETGIDCGGSCAACPTCSDGLQNQGETGVDCGGPCASCPSCFDGIQNQGETGIDCGGPCPACNTPSAFTALIDGLPFTADSFFVDQITGSGSTGYRIYGRNKTTTANIDMYINAINSVHTIIAGIQYNYSPLTAGLSVLTFTYRNSAGNTYITNQTGSLKFTQLNSVTAKASGVFSFDAKDVSNVTKHITSGVFTNISIQ